MIWILIFLGVFIFCIYAFYKVIKLTDEVMRRCKWKS